MAKKKRRKQNVRERRPEPKPEPTTPAVAEAEIEAMAKRLYYEIEDGEIIDQMIKSGQCTIRAYQSQIRAAEEGGEGWGPSVSPYEDRMTRSLQLKLTREKQRLMEKCRQRVRDELGLNDEPEQPEQIKAQPAKAGVETGLPVESEGAVETATRAESFAPSAEPKGVAERVGAA